MIMFFPNMKVADMLTQRIWNISYLMFERYTIRNVNLIFDKNRVLLTSIARSN